jgi:hypothetical protein
MANYKDLRYNFAIPSTADVGAMKLIKTLTASSSSTLSFVNGSSDVVLDSTYRTYIFKFINIHPSNDGGVFEFNMSADTGSNYNVAKTTTAFRAYHAESDAEYQLAYEAGGDLAQGTGFQMLNLGDLGGDNDQSFSGTMTLFNPSSTTFVKHFTSEANNSRSIDYTYHSFIAGYGNTTSAVDAIQFKNSSNNIDSGTIKMYGIV